MPTIRRAEFIIWNMCASPWCAVPTSHPRQSPRSPKLSAMLGSPRQPSLWKTPAEWQSLSVSPSGPGRSRGTAKSEMPFTPAGAPSMRASEVHDVLGEVLVAARDEHLVAVQEVVP